MPKNNEKIQISWRVPQDVKDNFTSFCNHIGAIIEDDCAGALIVWQYLPAELREQAKLAAKNQGKIDKVFWEMFRAGLELALAQQSIQQQKKGKR